MSTQTESRGRLERLRASPFLSEPLSNCLALVGLAIIDLAALSFLGFDAEVGTPTWGLMLSQGVTKGLLSGYL